MATAPSPPALTGGGRIAGGRFTALQESPRQLFRLCGILRGADCARQYDVVRNDLHLDLGFRQEATQVLLKASDITLDLQIEADDLFAAGTKNEDIGLTDRLAEQIDTARCASDGIGHGRIGHEDVMGIHRQINDQRLVETELDALVGAPPYVGDPQNALFCRAGRGKLELRRQNVRHDAGYRKLKLIANVAEDRNLFLKFFTQLLPRIAYLCTMLLLLLALLPEDDALTIDPDLMT